MSDFDKEAERERLREKYESEREDREATQQMSELLLKGATMTNSHCGNCGDPIFRYDGQEFCPSCSGGQATTTQQDADQSVRGQAATTQQDADQPADGQQPTGQQTTDQQHSRQPADGHQGDDGADAIEVETAPTPTRDVATPTSASPADAPTESAPTAGGPDARGDATDRSTADAGNQSREPVAADEDPVANVEATLERFAAAAARTDDPERAREYLAVVRDATGTLQALDR